MPNYDYESHVISIPDYPEPGIIFKDVTPLFKDPTCFKALVDDIAGHFANCGITKVIGAEARGFLIGAPVAYALGAGFIPARKPGKLPMSCRFTKTLSTKTTLFLLLMILWLRVEPA